ncbi:MULTISPECIES: competence type IV pilus major pilin ComGC [Aeribacillus]|jgi:competence protein ComGC|uniref:ComG operon protein 3 n=2 Tax=Aeribacillus TaxID=1055323 RepID=A0A165XRQ5_9BACI|nr:MULTISPECIES: competence type IV pilus major pilin ComGC [Aeribacillus]ASS91899.1 competence protein ComG [Aeribacillus pallidus]KZN96336.1 competence protein ComG [Aeribacillus pallidus]MDR9794389.1 competence type IV pilus major pilin ComGC [Aeribacillus pallidus]MDR9795741.1 competence type IV pilus major pilin ComGC [Aeribacillus pallidus]MED0704436.1 competence type IV pilus major pilin ComGC [Aeribacillus composti]
MKIVKNEHGFTLVEMLVVLLVISILLIITIPNVMAHNKNIQNKGCEGLIDMVQGQVVAYEMEFHQTPTINDLITKGYLPNNSGKCPNGDEIEIDANGNVIKSN